MAKEWEVFVGRTWFGIPVHYNLRGQVPHICIAGATGSGKSEFLKSLLYQACQKQPASKMEIRIVDLKDGATFYQWLHAPQVKSVHDTLETAYACLESASGEMSKRSNALKKARYDFEKDPYFKTLFVVFDEGGEMSPQDSTSKEDHELRAGCMSLLSELVRKGRETSVHIIYTTQRPDNDTLPTRIRSQLETRFCFRVKENIDSNIVIRHSGAEQLPLIPGRMIMQTPFKEQQVQSAYVPKDVITDWLKWCRDTFPKPRPVEDEDVNKQADPLTHTAASSILDMTAFEGDC